MLEYVQAECKVGAKLLDVARYGDGMIEECAYFGKSAQHVDYGLRLIPFAVAGSAGKFSKGGRSRRVLRSQLVCLLTSAVHAP